MKHGKNGSICPLHYTFLAPLVTFGWAEKDQVQDNEYPEGHYTDYETAMSQYDLSHICLFLHLSMSG